MTILDTLCNLKGVTILLLDPVTKISAQKESKYGSLMNLVKDLEDSVKKNRSQDIEEEKFTPWGGK